MICFPLEIGEARSLPWSDTAHGWDGARADYDRGRLSDDTLALLGPGTPTLVRMETLRRAAVYAAKDGRVAAQLHGRLQARAREAVDAAPALFDAGYFVEALKQARWTQRIKLAGDDGYPLVSRALALRPADAEMAYGAALVALSSRSREVALGHARAAAAGAAAGSSLARTLDAHRPLWGERLMAGR